MSAFLTAALRGHMPEAAIFPVLVLVAILAGLVLGMRLTAARSAPQRLD